VVKQVRWLGKSAHAQHQEYKQNCFLHRGLPFISVISNPGYRS
jgi:hypothetical protein